LLGAPVICVGVDAFIFASLEQKFIDFCYNSARENADRRG
jgi:hypothetical protein